MFTLNSLTFGSNEWEYEEIKTWTKNVRQIVMKVNFSVMTQNPLSIWQSKEATSSVLWSLGKGYSDDFKTQNWKRQILKDCVCQCWKRAKSQQLHNKQTQTVTPDSSVDSVSNRKYSLTYDSSIILKLTLTTQLQHIAILIL